MKKTFKRILAIAFFAWCCIGSHALIVATTNYDTSVDTFTAKLNYSDTGATNANARIDKSWFNDLQDGLVAVQNKLGTQNSTTTLYHVVVTFLTVNGSATINGQITFSSAVLNGIVSLGTSTLDAAKINGWLHAMSSFTVSGKTFIGTVSTFTADAGLVNGWFHAASTAQFDGAVTFENSITVPTITFNSIFSIYRATEAYWIRANNAGGAQIIIGYHVNESQQGTMRYSSNFGQRSVMNGVVMMQIDSNGFNFYDQNGSLTIRGAGGMATVSATSTFAGNMYVSGTVIADDFRGYGGNLTGISASGGSSARSFSRSYIADMFTGTQPAIGVGDRVSINYGSTVSTFIFTARLGPTGGGTSIAFELNGTTATLPMFTIPSNSTYTAIGFPGVVISSYSKIVPWTWAGASSTQTTDWDWSLIGVSP